METLSSSCCSAASSTSSWTAELTWCSLRFRDIFDVPINRRSDPIRGLSLCRIFLCPCRLFLFLLILLCLFRTAGRYLYALPPRGLTSVGRLPYWLIRLSAKFENERVRTLLLSISQVVMRGANCSQRFIDSLKAWIFVMFDTCWLNESA
jgi:hypothetical protein